MKICMDVVPSDINSNLLPFLMLKSLKFKINALSPLQTPKFMVKTISIYCLMAVALKQRVWEKWEVLYVKAGGSRLKFNNHDAWRVNAK